jgi:hypothetical protein
MAEGITRNYKTWGHKFGLKNTLKKDMATN